MPKQFEEVWKMPHAISCIDGKNIKVEWPELSGTLHCIYKGFYSIVLMAICDTNYCFTRIDWGKHGSNNDSGILMNSDMGKMFDDDQLNVPADCKLSEHHEQVLPYFWLEEEFFSLKKWLKRLYPGKNASEEEGSYNSQHSRAWRCFENAFGILSACWTIFHKPMRQLLKMWGNVLVHVFLALHKEC